MIAEAESNAHGKPVTEIHFHEVGTMDAIADIGEPNVDTEEGLPEVEKNPTTENLNAYTAKIYWAAANLWKKLEEDLWMKHGRGF